MAVEFYIGAMSPYSWISAERIDGLLPEAEWRPLFLGGLFKANGRVSWGLTDDREAGLRECEARAAVHGLGAITWPDPWPTSDLLVARAMMVAERRELLRPYALAAMRLSFREGVDLGSLEAILEAGERVGLDADELSQGVEDVVIKERVRAATERAAGLGIVGVPTLRLGRTLFWGDDRLEEAASHARSLADG